jgi:acyl carrier protein
LNTDIVVGGIAVDVASRIREFIRTEIMFEDDSSVLLDDTPLLGRTMDSLGLTQLVAFLEEEFGIEIDGDDVTLDNFETVANIERLVESKIGIAS